MTAQTTWNLEKTFDLESRVLPFTPTLNRTFGLVVPQPVAARNVAGSSSTSDGNSRSNPSNGSSIESSSGSAGLSSHRSWASHCGRLNRNIYIYNIYIYIYEMYIYMLVVWKHIMLAV